jgi:hypothetical protein
MRKFVFIWAVIIVFFLCGGLLAKANFQDFGIGDLRTTDDVVSKEIDIHYTVDEEYYGSMMKYPEQFLENAEEAPIVVIGKSTGKLVQHDTLFGQEIYISEIIKGDQRLLKEKVYAYELGGFQVMKGRPCYYGGVSIMKPNATYLCFLSPTNWGMMFDEKGYELTGGFFSYLNITTIHDSFVIKRENKFHDVWRSEFLSDTKKIVDQMNQVKEQLLTEYYDSRHKQ